MISRLGVDFGRVIHGGLAAPGEEDTAFLNGEWDEAMASPATPGMWEVLPQIVDLFGIQVWVISKCGARVQERTLAWLDLHDFYAKTGIPTGNVRFCRKRADKRGVCEELGITHMVDDRLDVHEAIRDVVPYRYLFGPQRTEAPGWVMKPQSWTELLGMLHRDPSDNPTHG